MPSQDPTHAQSLQDTYEIRPDPVALTHNNKDPSQNASSGVDYEPHPEDSVPISPENEKIVKAITSLYSGSASKEDMLVYAHDAIYDDPWSYCDTRYKIAGQWYGMFCFSPPPSRIPTRIHNPDLPSLLHSPSLHNAPAQQVSLKSWPPPARSPHKS